MKELIEELTKVNPSNLSEEGLKLFNKINEIIDRNEELEKAIHKEHTLGYSQGVYDCSEAWKETIKEKIEEVRNSKGYSPVNRIFIEQVLEELLNTKM